MLERHRYNAPTSLARPANVTEQEVLTEQLRAIDLRLSALEAELERAPRTGDLYSELYAEQGTVAAMRRTVQAKLRDLRGGRNDAERERIEREKAAREALVSRRAAEIADQCRKTAEQFASQGDHKSARLWRLQAFSARQQAEREC